MRKKIMLIMFVVLTALCLPVSYPGVAGATLTVNANHNHINVDYDYHGSTVGISGISDPEVDLVVTVASEDSHQQLKEKNKVAGVLWMNTADVTFDNVPNVYYLRSTRKVDDILNEEELAANKIGYQTLLARADIESTDSNVKAKEVFDEFVKYKEISRLYSTSDGGFKLSEESGKQDYYVRIDWPYEIPPGDYRVKAHAVKDGRVVEYATSKVTVERVGIVDRLTDMAQKNGALYGVVAIGVALLAGFGVGLIFRKGGGAH